MTAGVIPGPHLPFDFSGRFMNGQVVRLSFCNCASMLARHGANSAGKYKSVGTVGTASFGGKAVNRPRFTPVSQPSVACPDRWFAKLKSFVGTEPDLDLSSIYLGKD